MTILACLVALQELEAAVKESVAARQAQIKRDFDELAIKGGRLSLFGRVSSAL